MLIDTNVALPALLSEPGGLRKKFLVLLAFGALTYRAEHLELELAALRDEANQTGGVLMGEEALKKSQASAENRRASMAELLPYGTPDNWMLGASGYMIDEFEKKAKEVGARFGNEVDEVEAGMLRRQLLAISVTAPDPLYVEVIPTLTLDPEDDPILLDALRMQADYLISDDKHVVPKDADGSIEYELAENRILAIRFDYLRDEMLDSVDWDGIDGALLREALRLLDDDASYLDPTS